jgi:hypothetical protein
MVRTQIQLTEEQSQALKQLAARQDVSVAELIRRSVDALIESAAEPTREERWRRAREVAGMFHSGHSDLGINHDRYLAEAFAE